MSNVFEKFDKEFDVEGLKEDLKNVGANKSDYKEVPPGTYEMKLDKLELTQSKAGKPMVKCWMRILDGEYKNSIIFMNQVINSSFGLHIANEFLKSLESGVDIGFDSFTQYNNMLLDIHEAIDGKLEYALEYGQNNKGFNTFKIVDIFEAE